MPGTRTRIAPAGASAVAAGRTSARGTASATGSLKVFAEAESSARCGQRGAAPARGWITRTAQTNAPTIAADARKPARTRGTEYPTASPSAVGPETFRGNSSDL